jgi:hypothetical protein
MRLRIASISLLALVLSFSAEAVPSNVLGQFPASGAVNVAINSAIAIRFSAPFDSYNAKFSLTRRFGGTVNLIQDWVWVENASAGFVYRPAAALTPLTVYTFAVSTPAFSYQFDFTTGMGPDSSPPRLVALSPDPAKPGVSPFGPFTLQLSEAIVSAGGITVTDGTGSGVGDVALRLSADRRSIEFCPLSRYNIPPIVQVRFDPAAVRDLAGNRGTGEPVSARYVTSLLGNSRGPRVLGAFPEAGEANVPTNAMIQLLFDRALHQPSISGGIVLEAGGVSVPFQFEAGSNAPFQQRTARTIVMLSGVALQPETTYRVRVTTSLLDAAGLPVDAESSWEFTTAAGPEPDPTEDVVSGPQVSPVPVNARLAVRSPRRLPSFTPLLFSDIVPSASGTPAYSRLAVSASLLPDRSTLVLMPRDPLPSWAQITVDLGMVRDITGYRQGYGLNFTTSDEADHRPPELVATTPADGAQDVPVATNPRFVLDEPVGLTTPSSAVRITRGGEAVPGRLVFYRPYSYSSTAVGANALEFQPAAPLQPGADYEIVLDGVLDVAGNALPSRTIRFRTAGDSASPAEAFRLLSTNTDMGDRDVRETLVFEYSAPLQPGSVQVSAGVSIPRQYESALVFQHPIRTEVSGSVLNIVPLAPWPASRELTLSVAVRDIWGRSAYYSSMFHTTRSADDIRPEVISVTPPAGTPISAGQTIRLVFSEPMLNASQVNDGLFAVQSGSSSIPSIYWSDDRTTATILPSFLNTPIQITSPLVIGATSALVDLAGNPVQPFTARYPIAQGQPSPTRLPEIVNRWPKQSGVPTDLRAPLVLYLSAPVDAGQLNRSLWVVTPRGRAAGAWEVSGNGRLATFRPAEPWPASSTVRLLQTEPVISLVYEFTFSTAAAPSAALSIVGSTLRSLHPANAVIEVEFSQELPAGVSPLTLYATKNYIRTEVPCFESRPRPRVLRLIPRSPLPVGGYLSIAAKLGTTLTWPYVLDIGPEMSTEPTTPRAKAPQPDAEAPRTARPSIVYSARINELSLTSTAVRVTAGEQSLPVQLVPSNNGTGFTIFPFEPLPADQRIEVTIDGVEDMLGRRLPRLVWSFRTGSAMDSTGPSLLYTNAAAVLDPAAPLVAVFDEPLDPVQSGSWELSPDLQTASLSLSGGWKRGERYDMYPNFTDLSGNLSSISISFHFAAGFDPDHTPLALRAVSLQDGQTGVPLNPTFSLLFNKPLGSEALRSVRLAGEHGDVPLVVKATPGNRTTLVPLYVLDPRTTYQLIVEGVRDASGNTLEGRTVIGFTTGELLNEPAITAAFRYGSPSEPLRVEFSRPVDITTVMDDTVSLTYIDSRGGAGYTNTVPIKVSWPDDHTSLVVTPARPLDPSNTYKLILGAIAGSAGGAVSPSSFEFKASAMTDRSPTRVTIFPQDGSTNVPLNVNMLVSFSRNMTTPVIRLFENDQPVYLKTGTFYYGGFLVTGALALQYTLKPNQRYRIEVDGFRDQFDNDVPLSSSSFTTSAGASSAALLLVSSSPADGDAGVAPATPLTMTFNNPLLPLAVLEFAPQSSSAFPFRYTTRTNGPALIVAPEPAWPAASDISLILFNRTHYGLPTIADWTGRILQNYSLRIGFRTAAVNDPVPPVLESVEPAPGSTIPGGKASISLRFSKPVGIPTDALQVFYGEDKVSIAGVYSQDFRTVTYNLLPPANSRVTLVHTGDIRDNADNLLEPFTLEYPTGETLPFGPPTAKLTEPSRYSDVPADTKITIRFDRIMDSASVLPAIHVTQNGQNVSGSIEVLEDGRAYRFHPDAPFQAGAAVKVFISTSAKDTNGQAYWQDAIGYLNFYVAAAGAGSFAIVQRGFYRTAPADSILEVEFSGDLDPASVNDSSVWLRRGKTIVPGRAAVRDGRILQFTPAYALEPGAAYVLTAGSALRATNGRAFNGQDLQFQAVPPAQTAGLESVTETEWEGRPAIRVRFTAPVSPLAVRGLRLEAGGRALEAEARSTTDQREFVLIPKQPAPEQEVSVTVENAPDSNGRAIPYRRAVVRRTRSGQ